MIVPSLSEDLLQAWLMVGAAFGIISIVLGVLKCCAATGVADRASARSGAFVMLVGFCLMSLSASAHTLGPLLLEGFVALGLGFGLALALIIVLAVLRVLSGLARLAAVLIVREPGSRGASSLA